MKGFFAKLAALFMALGALCGGASAQTPPESTLVNIERAALTRWGNGDPNGYIQLASDDISYFDPGLEKRLDGKAAYKELLTPLVGKIHIELFEMQNLRVQMGGDIGIVSYNLVDFDKSDSVTVRWNSTEVYRLEEGEWKLFHSHWSFTKPELKEK
jgi:ketosteroid isomerase-like protein